MDERYHIDVIHYRDIYGNILWKEKMIFKKLWTIGDELVRQYLKYRVNRIAIADNVQHVNVVAI